MSTFEYKMVPAPTRGQKAKGVKTAEARFAHAVETTVNALAAEGWEYLRADTLPHEERQGLTRTATTFRTLLVFRRPRTPDSDADAAQSVPMLPPVAAPDTPSGAPRIAPVGPAVPSTDETAAPDHGSGTVAARERTDETNKTDPLEITPAVVVSGVRGEEEPPSRG